MPGCFSYPTKVGLQPVARRSETGCKERRQPHFRGSTCCRRDTLRVLECCCADCFHPSRSDGARVTSPRGDSHGEGGAFAGRDFTWMLPPWRSTQRLLMTRPRPVPGMSPTLLARWKASNSSGRSFSGMPMPLSLHGEDGHRAPRGGRGNARSRRRGNTSRRCSGDW